MSQVENYIVGAPCGVMDQMASSLGDEQALRAMSCQPAEVEPEVPIPPHLKFWGLDSGHPPAPPPPLYPSPPGLSFPLKLAHLHAPILIQHFQTPTKPVQVVSRLQARCVAVHTRGEYTCCSEI